MMTESTKSSPVITKMGIGGTQRNVKPLLNPALWSRRNRSRKSADTVLASPALWLFGPVGESKPAHPAAMRSRAVRPRIVTWYPPYPGK
jgi:hypothetical protein